MCAPHAAAAPCEGVWWELAAANVWSSERGACGRLAALLQRLWLAGHTSQTTLGTKRGQGHCCELTKHGAWLGVPLMPICIA